MKAFVLSITCSFFLISLSAQQSIPASGGEANGEGGNASYSIGQLVYKSYIGISDNSVSEGVQQAYEISIISGEKNTVVNTMSMKVFPNPTTKSLVLELENLVEDGLYFQLFDINGQKLQRVKIESLVTYINMSQLVPSTYILQIASKNLKLKEFKIVKN